jgi:hypothetical protein
MFMHYIGLKVAGSALLIPQAFYKLNPPIALLICTGFLNLMVCGLISCRLLYAHKLLGSLMADEKAQSPYIRALTLCIESSCGIYVVTFVGAISTLATSNQDYVTASIMLLPQICVRANACILIRQSVILLSNTDILPDFRYLHHTSLSTGCLKEGSTA